MFMTDRRKERKDIAVKDAMERHQVSRESWKGPHCIVCKALCRHALCGSI